MRFRWSLAAPQPLLAGHLARGLNVSPLLAQCLLNREFNEPAAIERFLQPRLRQLADPFLLPNMDTAVKRLFRARERKESLVIFGDYDVDGVTSTALLVEVLSALGWEVNYYLPHRMDEGYGLSQAALQNCLKKFPTTLLVAVDCGSAAPEAVAWLQGRGVDVIVLDHHQVSSPPPAAAALVNPLVSNSSCRPDQGGGSPAQKGEQHTDRPLTPTLSPYEGERENLSTLGDPSAPGGPPGGRCDGSSFRELCSVGLAFKLAHALVKRGRETGLAEAAEFDLRPLLDLVALGTIADLVPLTGENRILVSAGLARLNRTERPGLVALKKAAQCHIPVGTYEVGFQLAPRLNAAGRLETAADALDLLLARDPGRAMALAQGLDARNRERQQIERGIVEEVVADLRTRFNPQTDFAIVEGRQAWHIGVVGIVAARVLRQFYRPTIIVGGDGVEWRGSGRSIAGFDLAAALRECGDLLVRHGGHALAAGVSLQPANLESFRARLNELARLTLKPEQFQPPLHLDAEVGLEEMTLECLNGVERLKPTGQGNPPVQFCARKVVHQRPLQRLGTEKQHVKMWVTDGVTTHECVWWGAGNESLPVGRFDLAFTPQINAYNGRRVVQLKVLDWRAAQ